ncbi:MAG: glycerol-3-phosphate dehydrogenase/oxidase [Bryobacterales bacterium]|jgi:glycerol-3-phosphate dehydrogenase|nr:glycerol-3-phosphate dehydrogenase/oxidase [Bryobacterales bacterium]
MGEQQFDLAIVGGGIIGAGIARDAALRGMRCILLEQGDFGGGTTAGSTRLIHGGLRYLEMLDFGLVRMDLRERETLLRIAPHLVQPLQFFLPYYGGSWFYRTKMRIGLGLYDLLSYDKSLPNRSLHDRETVLGLEPEIRADDLRGASAFYDAQVNMPERLCLENVLDAARHGAAIASGTRVTGVLREGGKRGTGRIVGVEARGEDGARMEVRSKLVVNASGPWLNDLAGRFEEGSKPLIRTTKGIHLATAPLNRQAWVLFSPIDRRLFFAIPWMGLTWLGTTDTDYGGDAGQAAASPADIEYLLQSTQHYFPGIRQRTVCFTNAGVRALVMQDGKESAVSRSHRLSDGDRQGTPGLLTVLGGKITGYRAIAEEVTDLAARKLGVQAGCRTARQPLPGGGVCPQPEDFQREASAAGVPAESAADLLRFYGSRATDVLAVAREDAALARPLDDHHRQIGAQVRFAVRHEFCRHLDDFLARRTGLAFSADQGRSAAPAVAARMATELGWDAARQDLEFQRWEAYLERNAPAGMPA